MARNWRPPTSRRRPRPRSSGSASTGSISITRIRTTTRSPQEDVLAAFGKLIDAGKVRALGASNFHAARLKSANEAATANGLPHYHVLQPEYNLVSRHKFEGELEDYCVQHNIGVAALFRARRRLPDRQIPQRGGSRQKRARRPDGRAAPGQGQGGAGGDGSGRGGDRGDAWPRSRWPGLPPSRASPRRSRARPALRRWTSCSDRWNSS